LAVSFIISRSESEPITMETSGFSDIRYQPQSVFVFI
jgi:hypothetical protein